MCSFQVHQNALVIHKSLIVLAEVCEPINVFEYARFASMAFGSLLAINFFQFGFRSGYTYEIKLFLAERSLFRRKKIL